MNNEQHNTISYRTSAVHESQTRNNVKTENEKNKQKIEKLDLEEDLSLMLKLQQKRLPVLKG